MTAYDDAKAQTTSTSTATSTSTTTSTTAGLRHIEGLFDGITFPATLTAHVVDPGDRDRGRAIAGYDVSGLALRADFLSTAWLALNGELPSAPERRALSTALTLLAPLHVGESPVHAAVLARVAACADEALGGIAGTALGLFGKAELDGFAALCAYVDGVDADGSGVPAVFVDDADAAAFAAVADSVDGALALPRARALNRVGCGHALLARLQQRAPVVLSAWALLARLPVVFGEARHVAPGSVTTYATRTPDYRYVEERR